MSSIGRICLYCSKPISAQERVACCDRCFAAHHEECWDRNGRCSTFRCAGVPRTMVGEDLQTVVQTALERANDQPKLCPTCGGDCYAGALQSAKVVKPKDTPNPPGRGLIFVSRARPNPHKDWFGRHFLDKMLGNRKWFLPGAQIKSRSCGRCKRLYLWGVPVDDGFLQQYRGKTEERFCPHCSTALQPGEIILNPKAQGGAIFTCDDAPDFHKDWLGHNILDRYVYNRWPPAVASIPAHSCPDCQYTEVAGRPVYRFV